MYNNESNQTSSVIFDDLEKKLKENFVLECTRNKWRPIVRLMGTSTDKKLSKKFGFNASTIATVRRKMCIAPENFERICERYGADFERPVIL